MCKVCCECATILENQTNGGAFKCRECGCNDYDECDEKEVREIRTGGLDEDA